MRCDVWIIAAAIAACWAIGSMATAQQSNTPAFGAARARYSSDLELTTAASCTLIKCSQLSRR